MSFRILGLQSEPFRHLYGLSDRDLAAYGATRCVADAKPGYPDRIEIRDAEPGETLLLVNYTHQPADTPYRASHAIFVREGAHERYDRCDEIPDPLRLRPVSLRAFDHRHLMIDADLVEGRDLDVLIEQFFANPDAAYLQAHYAKRGCYAARVERV